MVYEVNKSTEVAKPGLMSRLFLALDSQNMYLVDPVLKETKSIERGGLQDAELIENNLFLLYTDRLLRVSVADFIERNWSRSEKILSFTNRTYHQIKVHSLLTDQSMKSFVTLCGDSQIFCTDTKKPQNELKLDMKIAECWVGFNGEIYAAEEGSEEIIYCS